MPTRVRAHAREGTRGVREHVRREMMRGLRRYARLIDASAHEDSLHAQNLVDMGEVARAAPYFDEAHRKIVAAHQYRARANWLEMVP